MQISVTQQEIEEAAQRAAIYRRSEREFIRNTRQREQKFYQRFEGCHKHYDTLTNYMQKTKVGDERKWY